MSIPKLHITKQLRSEHGVEVAERGRKMNAKVIQRMPPSERGMKSCSTSCVSDEEVSGMASDCCWAEWQRGTDGEGRPEVAVDFPFHSSLSLLFTPRLLLFLSFLPLPFLFSSSLSFFLFFPPFSSYPLSRFPFFSLFSIVHFQSTLLSG